MGISRFNSEGYRDPTPHEAVASIEKKGWMPLVYICSPYAGDTEGNSERARKYSRFAVEKKAIPFAPHLLLPQYLSQESELELAMFMDMVFLGKCEELWVFGDRVTEGMAAEIAKAEKKQMRIRYFTEEMEER